MYDRLQMVEDRYESLNELLSDPAVTSDTNKLRDYSKEQSSIAETVRVYRRYKEVQEQLAGAKEMFNEKLDDEMREMVKMEVAELVEENSELEQSLKILLLPKDPNDDKNVIIEIRGAAGGDEAALFAGDLFNMYARYVESKGWKIEVLDSNETGVGGYKEVSAMITGQGAYSRLKYENGAHRVQRVPETESGGRIHTSTATVAVMPEAEEVDIEIADNDVRVDIYHASGAGGQHVNKTASAVRLTHLPTGIAVAMQDERSQLKNREKAFKVLRARVYDKISSEIQSEIDQNRKSAIGTGDRSERIRTYNFPQNRVTDHWVKMNWKNNMHILTCC